MRKIDILSFLMVLVLSLVSCQKEEDEAPVRPEPREQVGRTVLVYMIGDNGNNDLSNLLMNNFTDMKVGMTEVDYSKCNLVVYSEMLNDVPHLISLKKKGDKVVADTLFTYQEQNPLAKEVMSKVIAQAIQYFPADSYGFVFLSHSSSWVPASTDANSRSIGYYRNTQMNISDFHSVLVSSFPTALKFVLFDSCSMQSAEVAYELRDCAEYFIGSPTEIPGPGAPYKNVVPELFTETNCAENIAGAYFDTYQKSYTGTVGSNANWTGGVAVSVIKSSALDQLTVATKKILTKYAQVFPSISRSVIQRYDYSKDDANYDLDDFIQSLTGGNDNSDYLAWRQVFDEVMVYHKTTPKNYSDLAGRRMIDMTKAEGLSIYIPHGDTNSKLNTFFRSFQWYSAAGWAEIAL